MKHIEMKKILIIGVVLIALSSCSKDLNLSPQNAQLPSAVFSTAAGYKSVLAKIYGTLSIGGNQGPAGSPDISGGLDEGSQVGFIRGFFNFQELSTDEAIEAWNDQNVLDNVHKFTLTNTDPFVYGMYARPIYNITLINQYLQQSTDAQLASNGITGSAAVDIKNSRAEARFLRAFNYWVMMDLFGKSSFITENSLIGNTPPEISRADLFKYVVSELKAIDGQLAPVKTIEYGRVDQGAEWALLARIYLNASTYIPATATNKYYDSAILYSNKVINGGYSLQPNYAQLFMADNDKMKDEFMFAITCDGVHTQGYGNTTFLVHAACGGNAIFTYPDTISSSKNDSIAVSDPLYYGVSGSWNGYRATSGLANLFTDLTGNTDKRALFTTYAKVSYTTGIGPNKRKVVDTLVPVIGTSAAQISAATGTGDFANGLHVAKFRNVNSDGSATHDPGANFTDIDFPVFRLSEMYLIYAEAVLRGGSGGDLPTAVKYFNLVRERAYGHAGIAGKGDVATINLQDILDERGRELYWEGHRRTDLIRYGMLTTNAYLWPWKGGVLSGTSVSSNYCLLPIPYNNIQSNPNLTQNTGY